MEVPVSTRRLIPVFLLLSGCGFINDVDGPSSLAIRKFGLSPREVTAGRPSTLSWDVDGAELVQIDNGVGSVKAKGSVEVKPDRTTTYTITARSAGSTATATVQLIVGGTSSLPSPSPTPTPSPTPSPSPSASPTPRPSPSGSSACGASVTSAQGCSVTLERLRGLPGGECIEITRVAMSQGCPLANGSPRAVSFEVMAETQLRELRWRKLSSSRDQLDPSDGQLIRHGATTAITTQVVQDSVLAIEIVSEGQPLLVFRLGNNN
jgi:hypothetical protein